ncbi:MAG: FAD-dependent oxidoreductase [Balneolaceae bacterium]|jgi:glycine/D-amino acid oxidase-like deaminating enzyme
MEHTTDYCILGAGIAGLSLADALMQRDLSVTVIDKESIAAGASGTPGGLVNPATGRRATKTWKAEQCYEAISSTLKKIQSTTDKEFYRNNGLLRPALLEKMAKKMRAQFENTTWPKGWCQWKTEEEIKEMHPGINCVDGGLWLPIGITVNVGKYLQAYATFLKDKGAKIFLSEPPQKIDKANHWQIELDNTTIKARNLVFATGHSTKELPFWDWLPLHLIKGQVATFKSVDGPLSFSHSISSLGYMARTGKPDIIVQGSTYEHDFNHLSPDVEGEKYLRKRMRRTLPQLEKVVITIDQWAGARTSTPNKKPILGQHPENKNLYVFTGLGSKGLMYGRFLADHYVDHLLEGRKLYPEVDIKRFE